MKNLFLVILLGLALAMSQNVRLETVQCVNNEAGSGDKQPLRPTIPIILGSKMDRYV